MRRRLAPLLVAAAVLGPAAPAGAHSAFLGSAPEPGLEPLLAGIGTFAAKVAAAGGAGGAKALGPLVCFVYQVWVRQG